MRRNDEPEPGYDEVFTVTEYYDDPRQGIANFNGHPHFYDCIFSEEKQDYSNLFQLTPIPQETFDLAIEDWAIWERWESAYYAGKVTFNTHPAMPEDRQRHEAIKTLLNEALKTNSVTCSVRTGEFLPESRPELPAGKIRPLKVKWSEQEPGEERYGLNTFRRS